MHISKANLKRAPGSHEVVNLRKSEGLTQAEAAELIYVSKRCWQYWEGGVRPMHPAFWELFKMKVKK